MYLTQGPLSCYRKKKNIADESEIIHLVVMCYENTVTMTFVVESVMCCTLVTKYGQSIIGDPNEWQLGE